MDSRLRSPTVIYDFFIELTRPKNDGAAQITTMFPKNYEMSDEIRKQIPKFVWPMRVPNDREEHFTFVLTDLDSKYKFGFCRYPPKGETCMCFLSDLPWYKVFYRALDKVADLLLNRQFEVVEPFLKGLHVHPIPNVGVDTILSVVPVEVDTGQVYSFPLPNPKKLAEIPTDDNLTQFYTNLHYNVILHLFANMIFERRIVITSSNLSLLSATVHGAAMILYPLHWQHIFIPITPPHLLDYCAAPMPFLMGVHSSYMDMVRRMPTDDIVILDVDESTIESAHVEDLVTLPSEVVSTLKHVLKKQSSAYGDTVTRSFMLAQVTMIGGYRSALKLRQGEKEVLFDEEQFLKSRPNMEDFLRQLLHFQHFRQFINSKIEKLKNQSLERDLFDNEVLAYEEELKGAEQVKAVFEKFISSTVEGSKKFAELSGKLGGNIKKQVKQARVVMKKNLKSKPQQVYDYNNVERGTPLAFGNPSLVPEKRSSTLPTSLKTTPVSSYQSFSGTTTPPPNLGQTKLRKPPAVIPYHRHIEGKKKLAESLKLQSVPELHSVSEGVLFSLTPPDTPRLSMDADQSTLDHGERSSLSSKGGEELDSVNEVAVGDLIDISTHSGQPGGEPSQAVLVTSNSSTSLSTASSNEAYVTPPSSCPPPDHRHRWERFDDEEDLVEEKPPPLPPPRSELAHLYNSAPCDISSRRSPSPTAGRRNHAQKSTNPFEAMENDSNSRPKSPFEDFSSSVGEALIEKLKKDPTNTSALASTGKELVDMVQEKPDTFNIFDSLDGHVKSSSAPVLQPSTIIASPVVNPSPVTTSSGFPTSASSTAQTRTHATQGSVATASLSKYPVYSSILRPIPQEGTFSADSIANNTNPFFCRSVNAGNYPALIPLSQKPSGPRSPTYVQSFPLPKTSQESGNHNASHRKRPVPPQKPLPYSGDGHWNQLPKNENNSNSTGVTLRKERQNSTPFSIQRLPSLGVFDPFGDLMSNEGEMAGYVLENSNISSS